MQLVAIIKRYINVEILGHWSTSLLSLCIILCGLGCKSTSNTPSGDGFNNLLDAVVRLDVREVTFQRGLKQTIRGVGSGVVMSKNGYILTNAHVVSPYAETINVTLSNLERVGATLIGWDHWTDLAVLKLKTEKIEKHGWKFAKAEFGDSSILKEGTVVFAVGTPNGLTRTVTRGIISNTKRYFQGTQGDRGYETGFFNTWLQTDAAINPGNSGGPLVTADGKVVGINTRGYLGANNLGFAVPSSVAKSVMSRLIEHGEVVRSYIGIDTAPLLDMEEFYQLEMNQGVLIQSVDPGSPAEKAGLKPSDIVLKMDGKSVDGRFPEQLPEILNQIAEQEVDSSIELLLKRNEQQIPISVITEKLESRVGEEFAFEDWGLSVQKVSRAIAREKQLKSSNGVTVVGVSLAYPADEAKIAVGDIIVTVNRKPLETLEDLKAIYSEYQDEPKKVLLEILHNHQVSYSVIKPR